MKAAAYAYMDGSLDMPRDLILLGYIDRFGAQNVLGRPLSGWEVRRMTWSERTVNAYQSRQASGDWVKWSDDHPDDARLLGEAMKAANDG